MTNSADDWRGWNGPRLDDLAADVRSLREIPAVLARIEGKLDAQTSKRWTPTAKSSLAAAFVVAAGPILSLLVVSH